jgi:NTP pyrophosphatase (non-canonical NTP hydrolase)
MPSRVTAFNDFQMIVAPTARYRANDDTVGPEFYAYPYLELAGEAGEVVEKAKKIMRDKGGVITQEDRVAIGRELGDVLYAVAQIAYDLDIPLADVAHDNVVKVFDRHARGVVSGSGDNR